MVNQIVCRFRILELSVRRKTMSIFSANGVKRLNHNQNSTAKVTDIPKIIIEVSFEIKPIFISAGSFSFPQQQSAATVLQLILSCQAIMLRITFCPNMIHL